MCIRLKGNGPQFLRKDGQLIRLGNAILLACLLATIPTPCTDLPIFSLSFVHDCMVQCPMQDDPSACGD